MSQCTDSRLQYITLFLYYWTPYSSLLLIKFLTRNGQKPTHNSYMYTYKCCNYKDTQVCVCVCSQAHTSLLIHSLVVICWYISGTDIHAGQSDMSICERVSLFFCTIFRNTVEEEEEDGRGGGDEGGSGKNKTYTDIQKRAIILNLLVAFSNLFKTTCCCNSISDVVCNSTSHYS